VRGVNSV
jgi:hypothetical protein